MVLKTVNAAAMLLVHHHAEHEQDRHTGEGVAKRTVFHDLVDELHFSNPRLKKTKPRRRIRSTAVHFNSGNDHAGGPGRGTFASLAGCVRGYERTGS